jgi:hypothetical protein
LRGLQLGGLPCLGHGFLQIGLGLRHSATPRGLCVRSFLHPGAINSAYGRKKVRKYMQIRNTLRCLGIDQSINQP